MVASNNKNKEEGGGGGLRNTFSLGPPTSNNPNTADDSGLMDDNELTTSFLPHVSTTSNPTSSSDNAEDDDDDEDDEFRDYSHRVAAAVTRPHSGIRLVMRRIGNILGSLTLIVMLIVIPIVTYRNLSKHEIDIAAFDSAGVMVAGTLIMSVRLVYLHLTHFYMPNVQKYVVRILWMVPLYAVQSWLSLRYRGARVYIDAARDLYEAYVISSFVYYLIELLGGQDGLLRTLRSKARHNPQEAEHLGRHTFPLSLVLKNWDLGLEFMLQCKHGVLQYVVMKAIATVLTFIFQSLDIYGEGEFSWKVAYPYLAFFMNMSVMYALYCLVKLFHAINDELRHPIDWHPLGKFLCVKGVVFFTWWQGLIIFYLYAHGIISDVGEWTGEEVANGLIDYCVCIEMVAFAVAHSYTFTYTEYLPSTVEEAMAEYEQEQQTSLLQQSADINDGAGRSSSTNTPSYHPPATLPRPMTFWNAFLSSTLPVETLHDIRRFQNGVDNVVSQVTDPGTISLRDLTEPMIDPNTTSTAIRGRREGLLNHEDV